MEMSTGNPVVDCLLLVGLGAGGMHLLKRRSPEAIAAQEKENVRKHEEELAAMEAAKVKSANDATVALMAQKHDSYRRAADSLSRSFQNNPKVDPADAQASLAALAKNFGIIS